MRKVRNLYFDKSDWIVINKVLFNNKKATIDMSTYTGSFPMYNRWDTSNTYGTTYYAIDEGENK